MLSLSIKIGINVLLLTHCTKAFLLLTANIEDVKKIAKKFFSDKIADQIVAFIAKASEGNIDNVSEENEQNVAKVQDVSADNDLDTFKAAKQPVIPGNINIKVSRYKKLPKTTTSIKKEPDHVTTSSSETTQARHKHHTIQAKETSKKFEVNIAKERSQKKALEDNHKQRSEGPKDDNPQLGIWQEKGVYKIEIKKPTGKPEPEKYLYEEESTNGERNNPTRAKPTLPVLPKFHTVDKVTPETTRQLEYDHHQEMDPPKSKVKEFERPESLPDHTRPRPRQKATPNHEYNKQPIEVERYTPADNSNRMKPETDYEGQKRPQSHDRQTSFEDDGPPRGGPQRERLKPVQEHLKQVQEPKPPQEYERPRTTQEYSQPTQYREPKRPPVQDFEAEYERPRLPQVRPRPIDDEHREKLLRDYRDSKPVDEEERSEERYPGPKREEEDKKSQGFEMRRPSHEMEIEMSQPSHLDHNPDSRAEYSVEDDHAHFEPNERGSMRPSEENDGNVATHQSDVETTTGRTFQVVLNYNNGQHYPVRTKSDKWKGSVEDEAKEEESGEFGKPRKPMVIEFQETSAPLFRAKAGFTLTTGRERAEFDEYDLVKRRSIVPVVATSGDMILNKVTKGWWEMDMPTGAETKSKEN